MPQSQSTPARLEAFSDGVLAVIITVMVLELKVPHADGLAGLRTVMPTLLVYLLSFTFTGVYWVNHSHLIDRLKRVDSLVLWANLTFLFFLSLLPFCTEYVGEKHIDTFSVQLYAVSLLFTAFGFQFLSGTVLRHISRNNELPGEQARKQHVWEIRKGWLSVACYLSAVLVARRFPRAGLCLVAVVTLIWIVPTFGQKHSAHAEEQA